MAQLRVCTLQLCTSSHTRYRLSNSVSLGLGCEVSIGISTPFTVCASSSMTSSTICGYLSMDGTLEGATVLWCQAHRWQDWPNWRKVISSRKLTSGSAIDKKLGHPCGLMHLWEVSECAALTIWCTAAEQQFARYLLQLPTHKVASISAAKTRPDSAVPLLRKSAVSAVQCNARCAHSERKRPLLFELALRPVLFVIDPSTVTALQQV